MSYTPPFYKQLFHSTRRLIAKYWLSLQPATQIAITGSQGKTNTTHAIAHILSSLGSTISTDLNLDTIYNVPITALKVMPWTKFAVFELGVDKPNEMDFHLQIVKPKIGAITGISPVHTDSEHLRSLKSLIKEKRKLIEALPKDGFAILNYDDKNVREMASFTKAKVFWYGTDPKHCDVWVDTKTVKLTLEATSFYININEVTKFFRQNNLRFQITTPLIGKHQIYTIIATLLVFFVVQRIKKYDLSINHIFDSLKTLESLPGRMSVENGPLGIMVLNDALRANPSSTKAGLESLSEIEYKDGKKIAILAEMGELQHPQEEHQKIINLIKSLHIDLVITIGHLYPDLLNSPQPPQILSAKDVYEAADILKKVIKKGDLIYLKGSLYRHVERVLHILEGKKPPADLVLIDY